MTHQYGNSPGQRRPGTQGPGNPGDDDLKARAQQVGEQAKQQAETRLDQQKDGAAERLDRLASSVRAAAGELEQQDDAQLSQYVSRFAGTLGDLADSLRSKNVDELMHDLRSIARRNPGLFVAGSVAIGFGLARFARASAQHSHQRMGADGADADAMGAWALDGGSDGGYRGSLATHAAGGTASARPYGGAAGAGSGTAAGSSGLGSSTGAGSSPSSSMGSRTGSSSAGTGTGSSVGGSNAAPRGTGAAGAPGSTPSTTRGGTHS